MNGAFDLNGAVFGAIGAGLQLLIHHWWIVPLALLALVAIAAVAAFFAFFADEIRIGIVIVAVLSFLIMTFGARRVGVAAAIIVGVPATIAATAGLVSWGIQRSRTARPVAVQQEPPSARRNG
jgi:hypothetical protein